MSISDEPRVAITLEVGVQGAEEILIALSHRAREKGMPPGQQSEIIYFGRELSTVFEKALDADPKWFDRKLETSKNITVKVTCQH